MKDQGCNGLPCVMKVIAKMSAMYSPVLKYSDVELQLRKNQEMDSSIGHPQQHCHQPNSGLLRYCSAPSSLLASLVDNTIHGCVNEESFTSENHQHYLPSTSSEMETMLSKLVSSNNGWSNSEPLQEFGGKPVKQEIGESVPQGPPQQNGYSYGGSQLIYQSQQIQGMRNGSSSAAGNAFDGSFGLVNSMASENSVQSKMDVRNRSNLFRQKSSPAGFFSIENDVAALREIGSFKSNDVSNGQATASTSGLHGTLTFSSRPSSWLKRMPQIAENENESLEENCDQSRNLANDNGSSKCYIPSFTSEFWDSSAFNAPKTESEDEIMFSSSNGLESQEADFSYQDSGLTHHLSPPCSSTKMASIEKFLQIQGSVPCKIRAKRGFATHPRSIAERVRRTRISERIKKLEGLFPKSEKQTSTAEMLDSAVEYIKDLQQQVKTLTDCKAKCKCTSNEKHYTRTCA
ncbi:dimerization protein [Spatholobus suberectus]|nr:dimerization protein [Spatholobus suberectus]